MKSKLLKLYLIRSIITLLLLELCSFLILQFMFNQKVHNVANLSIFKQTTEGGYIDNKGAAWVMPVKENYACRWTYLDFDVSIQTNSRGLRETKETADEESEIAFFGDSFTFGHGVEEQERYSSVFAKNAPIDTFKLTNFSYINGWQPEHYEYFLRKSPKLVPKIAVVGLYLGNDFDSDITETIYNRDSVKIKLPYRIVSEEGNLRSSPDIYRFPFNPLMHHSRFVHLLAITLNNTFLRFILYKEETLKVNQPNRAEIEYGRGLTVENRGIRALLEIKKIVEARGGTLQVLIIPQDFLFCPNKELVHIAKDLNKERAQIIAGDNVLKKTKQLLKELDISYLDASTLLKEEHYFKNDVHWNKDGHRVVGLALADFLAPLLE